MKKIFALLLVAICLLSVFAGCSSKSKTNSEKPAPIDEFEFETNGSGIEITAYKGNRKTVVIPSVIESKKVTYISKSAFVGNIIVNKIVIPEYIDTVDTSIFEGCDNLKEVIYQGSITTFKGNDHPSIKTIRLLGLKTAQLQQLDYLFGGALKTIDISNATKIKGALKTNNTSFIISEKLLKEISGKKAYLYDYEVTDKDGENRTYSKWSTNSFPGEEVFAEYTIPGYTTGTMEYMHETDSAPQSDKLQFYKSMLNDMGSVGTIKYFETGLGSHIAYEGFIAEVTTSGKKLYLGWIVNAYHDNGLDDAFLITLNKTSNNKNDAVIGFFCSVNKITVNGTTYSYDHK